jgi:hypothetical protein
VVFQVCCGRGAVCCCGIFQAAKLGSNLLVALQVQASKLRSMLFCAAYAVVMFLMVLP